MSETRGRGEGGPEVQGLGPNLWHEISKAFSIASLERYKSCGMQSIAWGALATLEHKMKALQTRLAATKAGGELVSDMERIKQRYSATPSVDLAENMWLLEKYARLLQNNKHLKVANVQLETHAARELQKV